MSETGTDPFAHLEERGNAAKRDAQAEELKNLQNQAQKLLGSLVQRDQYIGETLSMDFRNITVQVNDHHRRKVGGIPHLGYLIATRIQPWKSEIDWTEEDASVTLLRVLGAAPTPSDMMDTIVRAEAARRATGTDSGHWETSQYMDTYTRYELSFAGLRCEIIGTFYLSKPESSALILKLNFGTDISNFYPNKGLKVYKPVGDALNSVVNYRDPSLTPEHALSAFTVPIGHVRYASTDRPMQGIDNVEVVVAPMDMVAQRTALFGMSRTGKSNTTKIIARAIYHLRNAQPYSIKVGQLIFDYNGEYANENTQGGADIASNALKNVWKEKGDSVNDVITYGMTKRGDDKTRKLLQINVYGSGSKWKDEADALEKLDTLLVGKLILDATIPDRDAKYMTNFREIDLSPPEGLSDHSKHTRYRRNILVYRTLLYRANLAVPSDLVPETKGLFSKDFRDALGADTEYGSRLAADRLDGQTVTWAALNNAIASVATFVTSRDSGYAAFNSNYISTSSSGDDWADQNLLRILELFKYPNGAKAIAKLAQYHNPSRARDFAQEVYEDLKAGNLVIIDQAGGDPSLNDAAARRIMQVVFGGNQQVFINGGTPPEMLIYVEEAHNLLPPSKADDLKDIWVRTAKEGSKYRIGLVYATQEVSSIQKNILKNTANWFIAHLNNTDETKELKKFYDFANFEDSILRAQNRGFLRVKMLSNPYINPVQIAPFKLKLD